MGTTITSFTAESLKVLCGQLGDLYKLLESETATESTVDWARKEISTINATLRSPFTPLIIPRGCEYK